ncbi:Prophage PSSB64-01, helix-turn-helix XRE-family protein [Pseudomonas syringae pv. syringae B64]|nr:Prophage PSSB64-01, helix-turn-helix XRE-family protein [Pseudomonas syringae pv. syringae B64]
MRFRVISHGLQKTSNRMLVVLRYRSILLNHLVLNFAEFTRTERSSDAVEYVHDVEAQLTCNDAQIHCRRVARPGFVVRLSTLHNASRFGGLLLSKSAPHSLFAQSRADLFRRVQNYSSNGFTNARMCIILHSTPHENAWNCTMPNSTITEQARIAAREALERRGQTARGFALQHNLNPSTVYAVLSGQSRCRCGEAHRAAVLLGIKDGVITR